MDKHLELFTPLIECLDSFVSAEITSEYEYKADRCGDKFSAAMWKQRSAWHLANAIGWASR